MAWFIPVAGLALSAGGMVYQGIQQSQAAKQQGRALEYAADQERGAAQAEEWQMREATGRMLATQTAGLASAGVDLGSPSSTDLAYTSGRNAAYDMALNRYGRESQARLYGYQARATAAQGPGLMLAGGLSAAGRMLSAAPDIWPGLRGGR
jgi:hypothetical protein